MTSLKSYFVKYPHRDRAEADCAQLLAKHKFEVSTIVSEKDKQTVVLRGGTIPVRYNGALYNIPIAIQLPFNYPTVAPFVRVKPTDTMVLNPQCGALVANQNGLVRMDYLTKWKSSCTLLGMVTELQKTFSTDIPMFARPNAAPAPQQSQPYAPGAYSNMPTPSYPYSAAMPPPANVSGVYTAPTPTTGGNVYTAPTPNNAYPSYPGVPVQQPYPVPAPYAGYPAAAPGYPPAAYPYGQPTQTYPYPGYPPTQTSAPGYPPTQTSAPGYPPAQTSAPGYPPTQTSTPGYPPANAGYQQSAANGGLSATQNEELLKGSLISALRDKIRRRVEDRRDDLRFEIQSVAETQSSLTQGSVKLNGLLTRLAEEERSIASQLTNLREQNQLLIKSIAERESNTDIEVDPDNAVIASKPLFRQLAEAYAEEQALEDALYHLSSALRDQAVDSDLFLKEVRSLARRQFTSRLTVMKCREKAGLPSV